LSGTHSDSFSWTAVSWATGCFFGTGGSFNYNEASVTQFNLLNDVVISGMVLTISLTAFTVTLNAAQGADVTVTAHRQSVGDLAASVTIPHGSTTGTWSGSVPEEDLIWHLTGSSASTAFSIQTTTTVNVAHA
jgi:hypothetical protein